jgi:cytochrome c553
MRSGVENMRESSVKAVVLAFGLGLVVGGAAYAGDHHKGASLVCSDCHTMHYSQTHGYNADGTGFYTPMGGAGPYIGLLRNDVNNLCGTCHDNASIAPDVIGINTGKSPTDIRAAGGLNWLGKVGQPATGHTLDALNTAPGSNPSWKPEDENGTGIGLRCTNCHAHHGNTSGVTGGNAYRNLRTNPGRDVAPDGYVTYAAGTNDITKDVYERAPRAYDESQMDFNEPDNTQSAMGKYCQGCHTNFHGTPGDGNVGGEADGSSYSEFLRHPTAGVNIGALGGGHSNYNRFAGLTNRVKVMSESGVWNPPATDVTQTCVSCHKAHGNDNAFGLIFRSGTGTLTENGDSNGTSIRDLCRQCHIQGG